MVFIGTRLVGMTLHPNVLCDSMFDPTFDPMCHTMASFNPSLTAGLNATLRGQLTLPPVSIDECSGDIWPSTSQTRIVPFEEYKAAKAAKAAQKRKVADSKPVKPSKPTKPAKVGKKSKNSVCRLSFSDVVLPESVNQAELGNQAELREQDALVEEKVWRKSETCGSGL